jgi:hypothetical protein
MAAQLRRQHQLHVLVAPAAPVSRLQARSLFVVLHLLQSAQGLLELAVRTAPAHPLLLAQQERNTCSTLP